MSSLLRALPLLTAVLAKPFPDCRAGSPEHCPGTQNCTTRYFEQYIDHFNWAPPLGGKSATYRQRYFVSEQWWRPGGPIFFYFGNEDNVELYVNHSGLMWESAEDFGALLVWAEHRYYGESLPFAPQTPGCMSWLTTEQALADFAYLIDNLQANYGKGRRLPLIGFGGSYGGMMAAWFRLRYPQHTDGVVAASAPIWSFVGLAPAYDFNSFYAAVSWDASAAGGAAAECGANLKAAWFRILAASQTAEGRETLQHSFRTCSPVKGLAEAYSIVQWAQEPWASLAMGNFPYASSYLLHGASMLPPWPLRAACQHLAGNLAAGEDAALFAAVREAAAVFYNNTGDQPCFKPSQGTRGTTPPALLRRQREPELRSMECKGDWGYHWCTEIVQPFTQGTEKDMFYCPNGTFYGAQNCSFWDFEAQAKGCEAQWGVRPRPDWARLALASKDLRGASNIVFSNGLQDPWHTGGVLESLSDSVVAVLIPNGAHHIDLMFSDPEDANYPDIGAARELERAHMRKWVDAAQGRPEPAMLLV